MSSRLTDSQRKKVGQFIFCEHTSTYYDLEELEAAYDKIAEAGLLKELKVLTDAASCLERKMVELEFDVYT